MSVVSIGNYRLSQTLGTGSFGKVKLAEHIITGDQVAVKILNKEKVKTLKMDQKIRREIQIMKLFRHPHIIKLYEVIETESDILLIMEYVSGGELFEYIVSHGKMPEPKARRFFQQIIAAVEYCHMHMIVHRDLKPENLLLDAVNGSVKIADFGLSNVMEYGAFLKTSCGSPNYAAPEVISGKLYAGPEVDVWSCGVILYALLCARLPFDNDHIPTLFKRIRSGEYADPTHVSTSCRDLIKRCLCVDPLTRITIAEIRQHSWFQIDLPRYLSRAPSDVSKRAVSVIDPVVVAELQATIGARNVTLDEINRALNAPAATDGSVDPLAVAYHLLYDQKYAEDKQDVQARSSPPNALLLATSPPMDMRTAVPFVSDTDGAAAPSTSIARRGFGLLDSDTLSFSMSRPSSATTESLSSTPLTDEAIYSARHMWFLGKMTRLQPNDAMNEVYRVLLLHQFKWKALSPFSVQCVRENVKISLQLYRVSSTKHLLDVKKLSGPQFTFFDACGALLKELNL